jgi:hypothetical protein
MNGIKAELVMLKSDDEQLAMRKVGVNRGLRPGRDEDGTAKSRLKED